MDELQLAKLVQRVEEAFPGDPVTQRRAWEFMESVFAAWQDAVQLDTGVVSAAASESTYDTGRRFLDAYRSLLRDTGGRLASAVQVLLPPPAGLATLSRAKTPRSVDVDPDVAETAGLESAISVEYGADYLTLVVRVTENSDLTRLGGIAYMRDETMVVRRFERVDPTVAAAHFDLLGTDGPVGIVIALFDDEQPAEASPS